MSNLVLLVMCMAAGVLLRWKVRVPDNAHTVINAVIVHVSLPAVTTRYLHGTHFDAAVIAAPSKLAPRLVSMMVGIGIPLGMLTAPLWLWLGLAAA